MKNGKKIAAFLLSLCLVLACAGCGAVQAVKDVLPFGNAGNTTSEKEETTLSAAPQVTARPKVTPRPKATEQPWSMPESTPDPDGAFYFITRDDGTAFLTDYQGPGGELEIPDEFEGCAVTSIFEDAFAGNENITAVFIPDTVEYMGEGVFAGCKGLKVVKVSNNLYDVEERMFFETAISEISLPDCVVGIYESAFEGCKNLKEITVPKDVSIIGPRAFARCESLAKATIPPKVSRIDTDAFADCPNLTIYGYTGSEAERYANANKIPFVSIGGSPTPAPTAKPTSKPAKLDLAAGVIPYSVTLNSDWGNSITLNPDGTFCLFVNLYEGYGSVYGTYEKMSTAYEFTVYDRDFYGFIGDDVWKFWMTPEGNTLAYSGDQIGMVEAGYIFS